MQIPGTLQGVIQSRHLNFKFQPTKTIFSQSRHRVWSLKFSNREMDNSQKITINFHELHEFSSIFTPISPQPLSQLSGNWHLTCGCCYVGRQDLPPNNAMRSALGEAEKLRKQSGDSTSVTGKATGRSGNNIHIFYHFLRCWNPPNPQQHKNKFNMKGFQNLGGGFKHLLIYFPSICGFQ